MNVDERMDEDEQKQEEDGDVLLSFALGLALTGALAYLGALFITHDIIHAALLGILMAWWPVVILSYSSIMYNALSKRCSNKTVNILIAIMVGMLAVYVGGVLATGIFGLTAVLVGVLIAILWIIPTMCIYYIFERV